MTKRASLQKSLVLLGAFGIAACVPAGDGVMPPTDRLYFPVALALEPIDESDPEARSRYLFVVNSDFDLQFNQGTLLSLDLERMHELVPTPCRSDADCSELDAHSCDVESTEENGGDPSYFCVPTSGEYAGQPCGSTGENDSAARATAPGRCAPIELAAPPDGGKSLLVDAVAISAFATDALLLERPAESEGPRSRLFVPVRGDSTLHYVDIEEGRFECGQSGSAKSCSDDYRVFEGPNVADPEEPLETPAEPFGIAASADGEVIVLTHQMGGFASAFSNDWSRKPELVSIESDLPANPIGVALVPTPAVARALDVSAAPGFLMTFRNEATLRLLRFFEDGAPLGAGGSTGQERPVLLDVGRTSISVNSSGTDSRGVVVDDAARRAAEKDCAAEDLDCLRAAAAIPLDVYVANRTPNSLLVGQTSPRDSETVAGDLPTFHDNIPLTQGPSRVVLGFVVNQRGERVRRVFVVCFDTAIIYVYDPVRRRIESEIYTGRGPHTIAFDPTRPFAYVGHFTDSYLGVVSLDQRFPYTYGSTLASLGIPTPPRAAK